MKEKSLITKILLYQAIGFLAIIAVSMLVEITDLRMLVLGNHPYISDFRESALEMLFILAVWLLVAGATRRVFRHLRYLQSFMRVCAWCRHIHYKGEWIRLEEFMQQGFDTPTTHGICPTCVRRQQELIEQSRKVAAAANAAVEAEQNRPVPPSPKPLSPLPDMPAPHNAAATPSSRTVASSRI